MGIAKIQLPEGFNLQSFVDWINEDPANRCAEIKLEPRERFLGTVRVWAYDYSLSNGQSVTSADQINIQSKILNDEREQYEKLKKKFEPAVSETVSL